MGLAHGQFVPTDDFFPLRTLMIPVRDGTGEEDPRVRMLSRLAATTEDGRYIDCNNVTVFEFDLDGSTVWEVHCDAIVEPPYAELFPEQHKAYYGR